MAPMRISQWTATAMAITLSFGFASLIAPAQTPGHDGTVLLAARSKPKPSPSPSPGPTSADWVHALVAPTLDASCASPNSQAQDVRATSDGGYVVAGSTQVSTSSGAEFTPSELK